MAYDTDLADRIRALLSPWPGVTEKRMFGGLAFLVNGHMSVAATGSGLMVRVVPAETEALRAEPGAGPMEMQGRVLNGWVLVESSALDDEPTLRTWVERGVAYAGSLPPK